MKELEKAEFMIKSLRELNDVHMETVQFWERIIDDLETSFRLTVRGSQSKDIFISEWNKWIDCLTFAMKHHALLDLYFVENSEEVKFKENI